VYKQALARHLKREERQAAKEAKEQQKLLDKQLAKERKAAEKSMAPKAKSKAAAKGKAAKKEKDKAARASAKRDAEAVATDPEDDDADEEEGLSSAAKRLKMSGMVTSLKAKDPATPQGQTFTLYTSLARNDPEKGRLLQEWLKDKTCSWIGTYSVKRAVVQETVSASESGYGTEQ
jgi:hypothetical protein